MRFVLLVILALAWAAPASAADIPETVDIDPDSLVVSRSELICLALNDYFESRGESLKGRVAVAHVVLNRSMDRRYPSNLCDVVKENRSRRYSSCQFSWHCDRKSDEPTDEAAWAKSLRVATAVLTRDNSIADPTGGALWYHAKRVNPDWAKRVAVAARIGNHVFYREHTRVAAAPAEDEGLPETFADHRERRGRL